MATTIELLGALVLLVVASDAFTNAVEWIGALYGLTRSALGAIVAAVGSSLPETMVAVVALVILRDPASQAVGIGAVLGAPFMLATVVFALIGIIAFARNPRATAGRTLAAEPRAATIGLALFLVSFALIVGASFDPTPPVRALASFFVIAAYVSYLVFHFRREDASSEENPPPLRLSPAAARPAVWLVVLQLALALIATVFASRWFIASVTAVSARLDINPLIVSLYLSPIATEVPEAMNVILWMRRGQDELAVGNVIGAMLFQTSIASAIAMLASPWLLDRHAYEACATTALAVVIVLATTMLRRRLVPIALSACGLLYFAYVALAAAR